MWVSLLAPWGTIILMYIFGGMFHIKDKRIISSIEPVYLERMLIELKKEMNIRFGTAYFITISIFAAVFFYVIKFTASFGWEISWVWWYSGLIAIFLQFVIMDTFVSIVHLVVYKCSKKSAQVMYGIRSVKQAETELH